MLPPRGRNWQLISPHLLAEKTSEGEIILFIFSEHLDQKIFYNVDSYFVSRCEKFLINCHKGLYYKKFYGCNLVHITI
jgi:hypothetical protein